jgi:hypothetical protein
MMGELIFFLGIHVKQTKQGTFIHQAKYMTTILDLDENGEAVDQIEYRSMIGSLLYLIATWRDIQFTVFLYAYFQASPRTSRRWAIHQIFRYLKYTLEFGIWYSASSSLDLVVFSDADFSGCGIDRKTLLVLVTLLDLLLFVGLLANKLLLHNPPERQRLRSEL